MKITDAKKDKNFLRFVLEDSEVSFANALRRAMISEVPTFAIEDVTFFENNSALYDEMVAHRLGLIPIKSELRGFSLPKDCSCKGKGCSKCQVSFALVKKGPATVYSGDLKSSDSKITVADEEIPITKLLEGQKLKLEAIAVLGIGKDHAKFQPGVISYKYYPEVKIKDAAGCKKAIEVCPKKVFGMKGDKIEVVDLEACNLCNACVEACKKGAIEVKGLDTKFIFTVESNGSYKPEQIAIEAAGILEEKAKEFEKELK